MWPEPTPPAAFAERRRRLRESFAGPALVVSGLRRPRNFAHNLYPFRAESHFLYLVGRALEGAALLAGDDGFTLFAREPDPAEALWSGPSPSLGELSTQLGLAVRPISEITVPEGAAVLPPQDAESAAWVEELTGRDVVPGGGAELDGADATLADTMIELRLRHDAAAVEQLRQAAAVTALAHGDGMAATRAGLREAAIRAAMERRIIASGMTCAYGSIVTIHGDVLHDEKHHRVLADGDLLLADVGAETPEGWAGDVTRTWPVSGTFSGSQRAIYDVVLAAQRGAIAAVRPGVRYRDVHRAAGRAIVAGLVALGVLRGDVDDLHARGAAGLFFPHGVGHLLGLDVHDMEDLGDRAGYAPGRTRATSRADRYLRLDRDLEPGMAVTIEPGFYLIDGLLRPDQIGDLDAALVRSELERYRDVRGIRIEDDVLVTADGADVLTASLVKEPDDVAAAVRG